MSGSAGGGQSSRHPDKFLRFKIMKRVLIVILIASAFAVLSSSCSNSAKTSSDAIPVILDTDMGNDVDDALALAMLNRYSDEGRIKMLGVMINKNDTASAECVDIINTYYGYGDTPIGVAEKPVDSSADGVNINDMNFVTAVSKMDFPRTVKDYSSLPSAVQLYRRLLASQEDNSVKIISVGFSTNLAALLDSQADDISPLTGRELLEKKVKEVCVMAGNFRGEGNDWFSEYNVQRDIPSARKFFAECPAPMSISPFELGIELTYPGASIEKNLGYEGKNPVAEAYKAYLPMPYDRPIWDLTAVLYAVEGEEYFTKSVPGKAEIDENGLARFTQDSSGKHVLLSVPETSKSALVDRCRELCEAR